MLDPTIHNITGDGLYYDLVELVRPLDALMDAVRAAEAQPGRKPLPEVADACSRLLDVGNAAVTAQRLIARLQRDLVPPGGFDVGATIDDVAADVTAISVLSNMLARPDSSIHSCNPPVLPSEDEMRIALSHLICRAWQSLLREDPQAWRDAYDREEATV